MEIVQICTAYPPRKVYAGRHELRYSAAASFAEIGIPIALVGGTADVTEPVETNIKRRGISAQGKSHHAVGSSHYTFSTSACRRSRSFAIYCRMVPELTVMVHARRWNVRGSSFIHAATTPGNASFEGEGHCQSWPVDELTHLLECSEVWHSFAASEVGHHG